MIKPKTAKELISILQQVPGVDETANQPWGIIPNYAVASKTGTANESPNEPGESCPASNPICIYGASYIGMAPGNGPQVVVAVNVQDPNKSHQDYFGDMVAGPVFYNVMNERHRGAGDSAPARAGPTGCSAQCALILDTLRA